MQPYYESVGAGKPLALWHGGIADLRMWDDVRGIPGAQQIVFPDIAHMIPMERAAEFNRAVRACLQRHPMP